MKVYSILVDINGFMKMQKAQSITYNNIFRFVAKYLIKDYLHIELLEANDQFAAFFDATLPNLLGRARKYFCLSEASSYTNSVLST